MDDRIDSAAGAGAALEPSPQTVKEIGEDLSCPMCGYNLRGLSVARCPECGYACEWEDLIDPTRRLHPYLFEHHPEKNVRSFLRTAAGTLLPRRFWRDLHPAQPGNRRRLIAYWCVGVGGYVFGIFLVTFALSFNDAGDRVANTKLINRKAELERMEDWFAEGSGYFGRWGSAQGYVDFWYPTQMTGSLVWETFQFRLMNSLALPLIMPIAWSFLTFASLMLFRWSMRRAKVLNIHVLRSVVYSFDITFWISAALIVLATVSLGLPMVWRTVDDFLPIVVFLMFPLMGTYRLWMAYRGYLQFSHAFATVLSCQIIVFLALMVILAFPLLFIPM